MRVLIAVTGCWLAACGNAENAGAEAARRQAEADQKAKLAKAPPVKMQAAPVPGEAHIPCSQLIDLPAFQAALGEKAPLELRDARKSEPEAAASCSLVRGGKRLTGAEQDARSKRTSRLGVLPGDELCNISAFCSSRANPERFRASCKASKGTDDDLLGGYACVHTHGVGEDDVKSYRLIDDDTGCILQIRGGPSNVDNEMIRNCARTARDRIGPAQIQVELEIEPTPGSAS